MPSRKQWHYGKKKYNKKLDKMNKVCYNISVNRKNIGDNKIMAEQKATKKEYAGGRRPYNPYRLFATIIYAFSKHSGSVRKIEESLNYDLRFIYLMEQERPSYVTISSFLNNVVVTKK